MNPSEEENARMDAAYDQPPQQGRAAMSGIQQPKEATSWEVIECDVCGAPVLFLADDTGARFAQIHLDGDSLEDLVAELIDLSGDDEDTSVPEGPSLQGLGDRVGPMGQCALWTAGHDDPNHFVTELSELEPHIGQNHGLQCPKCRHLNHDPEANFAIHNNDEGETTHFTGQCRKCGCRLTIYND
jgi:hypothetical protein